MINAGAGLRRTAEMLDEFDAATGAGEPAGPQEVAGIYDTVAELARRRLDGVRSASVTTWDGRRFSTAAATDDGAVRADLLQYDRQSGPCVAAVRDVRECHVPELSTDPRWPADARAEAADLGFAGVLSLRLTGKDTSWTKAGLNLYLGPADQVGAETVAMASLLAGHVRMALLAAESAARVANLEQSKESSQRIGAAIGVLMAKRGLGHDEAMGVLRTASQRSNTRVSELAAQVVATGELPAQKTRGPRR